MLNSTCPLIKDRFWFSLFPFSQRERQLYLTFEHHSCCDPQIHHHKREFLILFTVILDFLSLNISQSIPCPSLCLFIFPLISLLTPVSFPPSLTELFAVALLARRMPPLGEKHSCSCSSEASCSLQHRGTALIREKNRVRREMNGRQERQEDKDWCGEEGEIEKTDMKTQEVKVREKKHEIFCTL